MRARTAHKLRSRVHLGLRIIKTGIAVTLCLVIYDTLKLPQAFVAVVTAILSMGPSIDHSIRAGKDSLLAAAIGAVIGALAYHVSPQNPGLCGMGIILVIFLCQTLRLRHGTLMASFMFVMVMLHQEAAGTIWTVGWCLLAACLGIIIALAVNLLILPPNYSQSILQKDRQIYAMLCNAARACEDRTASPDLEAIQVELHRLERDIRLYVSEWKIFRNQDSAVFEIARRVVSYREILTDLWAIDRLDKAFSSETATVFAYHINRSNALLASLRPALPQEPPQAAAADNIPKK
ncbi:MAG: aromatic acid exporter family protein [Oscillospiraceae bacterium]|jgi:uncharacterized membrane protein YgaE (UPF0421/DUF939 family)|nr:aromatic acid exporter family protein [Oscillospiraceae bacterium]